MGHRAERTVAEWLRRTGYRILDRNWRSGRRELDLVALDGDTIVFIEVKGRSPGPQSALEALSGRQRIHLRRAAEAWIHAHPTVGRQFRFDLIGVELQGTRAARIEHIRDAFTGDP